jgi:ABC-type phosphate transport system substrate-binding protein
VRWAIYAAIVLFLWIYRPGRGRTLPDWVPDWVPGRSGGEATARADSLLVAGTELAPDLTARLLEQFGCDHPNLWIGSLPGGTNRALEALGAGRAAAAFLFRPPTPEEQTQFREACGDTVLWFPIALGGLVLLVAEGSNIRSFDAGELRNLVRGAPSPQDPPLFAEDPNRGTWAALRAALADSGPAPGLDVPASLPGVTFLCGPAEVVDAIRSDPAGVALISTLVVSDFPPAGTRALPLRMEAGSSPVLPSYEAIGTGEYPLHHRLLVACLPAGEFSASMFVTHLVSDRGQRQVERAGQLPARLTARDVRLNRDPIVERSSS